jgi:hypothetical protein
VTREPKGDRETKGKRTKLDEGEGGRKRKHEPTLVRTWGIEAGKEEAERPKKTAAEI